MARAGDGVQANSMGFRSFRFNRALALLALASAVLAPFADAQASLRGKQAGGPLTSPAQSSSTSGLPQPAAETKDIEGLLAAQNDVRRMLNLAPLTWSGELTAAARKTAEDAAANSCSRASTLKQGDGAAAAVYWAAPMGRYSGGASTQTITPGFLVSEWQTGKTDYDSVTRECRRSGECQSWARMVAPAARAVGCVRVVCPSQAQIWACHYDTPKAPAAPPDLRRRSGN
jgi:pathogenesis-related protein 1